jgi:hypothetical protein
VIHDEQLFSPHFTLVNGAGSDHKTEWFAREDGAEIAGAARNPAARKKAATDAGDLLRQPVQSRRV